MALLNKTAILNAQDLPFEIVDVPEWGGEVKLRTLTGREKDLFVDKTVVFKGKDTTVIMKGYWSLLLSMCIVDDDGAPMFTADELGGKSSAVLEKLGAVAHKLNGMGPKDVEEMQKN